MTDFPRPPHGVMLPPTLVTRAQAARILGKSQARVHILAKKGGQLEAEIWHGTPMIPMYKIMAYMETHPAKVKP